jgi:hypothetical protein
MFATDASRSKTFWLGVLEGGELLVEVPLQIDALGLRRTIYSIVSRTSCITPSFRHVPTTTG